ncbi:methyltransferase family protein [Methylomagnum sp.]
MEKLVFVPPPVIALILVGLAYALETALPGLTLIRAPLGGFVLAGAGFLLALSALLGFLKQRTTPIPHGEPSALVVTGAYRWTRNPMYLGILTALFGVALYFGTLFFYLVPPAFVWAIGLIHVPFEEAKLSALFGTTYDEFRKRIPRWL